MDSRRKKALRSLEAELGVEFENLELLEESLTHSSFVNEKRGKRGRDNEGLEFLGDAVLGLVVSDDLYHQFPSYLPGEYSALRASLVNQSTLAACAREISLGSYLKLGRGEEQSKGRERNSALANALEAVIGAIFLDKGLDTARSVVLKMLRPRIEEARRKKVRHDSKSRVQNVTQDRFKTLPDYRVVNESGPDHKRKFEVELVIQGKLYGRGVGRSKKAAEQAAAKKALRKLEDEAKESS